jgi:hypothetical protein
MYYKTYLFLKVFNLSSLGLIKHHARRTYRGAVRKRERSMPSYEMEVIGQLYRQTLYSQEMLNMKMDKAHRSS